MKYVETRDIPLAQIQVGGRLREVDPDEVEPIRVSMAESGQITPIAVMALPDGGYRLVAGAHRWTAARELDWQTIRAEIITPDGDVPPELQAELAEIDENLHRHELNPLDRANFVGRRLEIYESLHPGEHRQGGDRRSKGKNYPLKFSEETAGLLGRSEEVVKRSLRIWRLLAPVVRLRLRGTHLARMEGDLYRLTRYSPEQQIEIVDRCLTPVADGDQQVYPSVGQVAAELDGMATAQRPAHEVEATKLRDSWDRAGLRAKKAHLQFLVDIGVIDAFTVAHL